MTPKASQILALSFVSLVCVATIILMLPLATVDGAGLSFTDAFFTATSAICLAGLSVIDIGHELSIWGQSTILFCIQAGGLGIMSLAAVVIGVPRLRVTVRDIVIGTLVLESIGAISLFVFFSPQIPHVSTRLWWSLFHAITAFCNSGFSLSSSNLMPWAQSYAVCLTISALVIFGGLGFVALTDLLTTRTWRRLQPQTKIIFVMTILLNVAGTLLFLFFEYNGVFQSFSIPEKINAAFFQAVTCRTAGFHTIATAALSAPSVLIAIVWMFIGASSGSTSGGVKTTTIAVAVLAWRAMLQGKQDVEVFGRRLAPAVVRRSFAIILMFIVVLLFVLVLLLASQTISFERLLFEAVSAFGLVGLSMNVTRELDSLGRWLIIILMYIGHVGPLMVAYAIADRIKPTGYKRPTCEIAVG